MGRKNEVVIRTLADLEMYFGSGKNEQSEKAKNYQQELVNAMTETSGAIDIIKSKSQQAA